MQYYINKYNSTTGPYTVEQLLEFGLTADTLVWNEELVDWKPAKEVHELAAALGMTTSPPPIPGTEESTPREADPEVLNTLRSYRTWSIILMVVGPLMCCNIPALNSGYIAYGFCKEAESCFKCHAIDKGNIKFGKARTHAKIGIWSLILYPLIVAIIIMYCNKQYNGTWF